MMFRTTPFVFCTDEKNNLVMQVNLRSSAKYWLLFQIYSTIQTFVGSTYCLFATDSLVSLLITEFMLIAKCFTLFTSACYCLKPREVCSFFNNILIGGFKTDRFLGASKQRKYKTVEKYLSFILVQTSATLVVNGLFISPALTFFVPGLGLHASQCLIWKIYATVENMIFFDTCWAISSLLPALCFMALLAIEKNITGLR